MILSKINIYKIIPSHLNTFQNLKKRRRDWEGLFTMFVLPIAVAYLLLRCYNLKEMLKHINDLLVCVSIFGGFLFNLLALIYTIIKKVKVTDTDDVKKRYSREIHSNIAFGIFVAILSSVLLILFSFKTPLPFLKTEHLHLIINIALGGIYYVLTVFLFNLLLILKKVFILLENP